MTEHLVVVTGANGFVGARVSALLAARGVAVRALVRRPGTAPRADGVEEVVGDFLDPDVAASVVAGATAVVATVHPMGDDRATQHRVGVEGTAALARAAVAAGVDRFVHVSTAAVHDRSPGAGDVDESSPLVGDDAGDYPVTKRDADAALAAVDGITRVLARPPAILGPGESSIWNTLRPAGMRDDEGARHDVADASFPWVHVDDLAAFLADAAVGASGGPEPGTCTPVLLAASTATRRDYTGAVTSALGVEPVWDDAPAWTGRIVSDRARSWGWTPSVGFEAALAELREGLGGPAA